MTDTMLTCLNCQRPESLVPLVSLRYQGASAWICSQCLPILIHKPQQLAGRLTNAESIAPANHHD